MLIILVLVVINVSAQPDPRVSQPNNVVIKRIANKVEKTGWITYKRGIKLTGREVFGELKDAFGLSIDDSMQEKASQNDESQNRHLKFQQFYKGVPIEDSEYFLHYNKDGELTVSHGKIAEGIKLDISPRINSEQALQLAIAAVGAEQYVWQDSAWERSIRITKGDSSATNRPIGKLVITFDEGKHLFKENAKLAYYFVISVLKPSHGSWGVYINAQNGQVIKKNDLVHHCINSSVNFTSLYNGAQSTVACKTGFLSSRRTLKREDGNMNIITKRETGSFPPYVNLSEVHNSGTSWGTTDQQFTSSHWAIERSWTYFRDSTNIRNLNNPAASCCVTPPPVILGQPAQPDVFMGPRWFVGAADNGGVHTNGGVQNRWFSLLANGGTHNGITVTGIGIDNAAAIAYGNMTLMLGAASGYVDARNGSVAIASFLFGCESNALLQTINAWTAVGLPGTPPALNINGPLTICNDYFPSEGTFEACWLPGATYTWSFPSDLSGSVSGTNNKFLTLSGSNIWGTFPISVTGTLGGMSQTSTIEVTFTNCQNLRGGDETSLLRKTSTLKNEFVVYPNPASEILNVKLPLEDLDILYQVQITNLLGQTLITKQVSALSNNIDIHNLTSGLYHVTIRNTEGVIKHNVKILKQ